MNSDTRKVLALAVVAAMITISCTCPLFSSVAHAPYGYGNTEKDSQNCDVHGTGRQWVSIDFKRNY